MRLQTTGLAFLFSLALAGCASSSKPADPRTNADLGDSKASAIEVCKPLGERAYLARLVCADGTRPSFNRMGSVGPRVDPPENMTKAQTTAMVESLITGRPLKAGEPDHHVVDRYEVTCGAVKRTLYMDMYHCHSAPPERAPVGFSLQVRN